MKKNNEKEDNVKGEDKAVGNIEENDFSEPNLPVGFGVTTFKDLSQRNIEPITIGGDIAGGTVVWGDTHGGSVIQQYDYAPVWIPDTEKSVDTAVVELRAQIEDYFDIVAESLYENQYLQDNALNILQKAKELLSDATSDTETLSKAQFEVRRVHVIIAKEQQIRRGESRLRWLVPALVLLYIALIIGIVAFVGDTWTATTELAVIGMPVSVVVWAAIGSVAAILYRFYTRQRGRIFDEIRWLIARPIIGVIMGSLTYLSIISGLLVFGVATGSSTDPSPTPQLLWLLAFLGGFSDKFFEGVISLVAGRFTDTKVVSEVERRDVEIRERRIE